MNLAFINSSRTWGGGEVWLQQIANGLHDRGHSVTVICRNGSELWDRRPDFTVEVVPFAFTGDFSPARTLALYRILTHRHCALVCTNWEKELRLATFACLGTNIRVVPSREVDRPIRNTLLNRLVYGRLAAGILFNSEATRATMVSGAPWLASKRSAVVWKGVDLALYHDAEPEPIRQRLGIDSGDLVCGFVGRLDEQKGIATLIDAMRIVANGRNAVRLVVAGDGPLRGFLEEALGRDGLASYVHFPGFRRDVPALMKSIDLLVMPSLWEGFGYAAVEAMAAEKPVIASNTSSLPEIVVDGVTGMLIPPGCAESLAEAILVLGRDPAKREAMGKKGLERVREEFGLEKMILRTEAFFSSLLE